jgi:hypothetical protein
MLWGRFSLSLLTRHQSSVALYGFCGRCAGALSKWLVLFLIQPMKEMIMTKAKRFFGSVKNKAAVAGGVALGLATSGAHAAISTTEVTGALTDAGTAAGVVAAAVIVVIVGIKAFKYIRSAL